MGTRLRGIVSDMPKPMAPINDRPFLEYLMDYWISQGVNRFIISVGYMKEKIINHFGCKYKKISLEYIIENKPLGTGGGLILASQNLKEPFLLLNGDTFFEVSLNELMQFHNKKDSDWTFSLSRVNNSGRYKEIKLNSNGRIIFNDGGMNNYPCLINGGVYLIKPCVLQGLENPLMETLSLENEIFTMMLEKGYKLHGMEFTGKFIDIGTPQDYLNAKHIL